MNKKDLTIFIIVPIIFLLTYFLITHIILSAIIALITIYILITLNRLKMKNQKLHERINSSYQFCNYINMQMLSSKNLYEAYQNIETNLPPEFLNLNGDEFLQQIDDIASSYSLNAFNLYAKTLILYSEKGGSFFKMTQGPTLLCQKTKVYFERLKKRKKAKLLDIVTLYSLWIFVLLFLKIGMNDYYNMMITNHIFQISITLVLLLGIISLSFAFINYYKDEIEGL